MGNSASRVVGCFRTQTYDDGEGPGIALSDTLDEGLGHSFCYIRPALESPLVSPPHAHLPGELAEKLGVESDLPEHVSHEYLEEAMAKGRVGLDRWSGDKSKGFLDRPRSSFEKLKAVSETSFKSISGASVSANTATPRSIFFNEQFAAIPFDRAADFKSTSSFTALPLQPVPRGLAGPGPMSGPPSSGPLSGPLDRGFLSGPLERGFMSGPLERGFLSGPLERGYLSGPLEPVDRSHFSAPLGGRYSGYLRRRRHSLSKFVKAVSRPFKKAIAKTSARLIRTQRGSFLEDKQLRDVQESPPDTGYTSSELETKGNDNLQWAQGKAGEDRVHVVLSEEHGWLFVGIYDGFNGPDAPDFLMSNLYPAIYRELKGLLWDQDGFEPRCAGIEEELEVEGCYEGRETAGCCHPVSCAAEINYARPKAGGLEDYETEVKDGFAHDSVVSLEVQPGPRVGEDDKSEACARTNVSGCTQKNRTVLTPNIEQGNYGLNGRRRDVAGQALGHQGGAQCGSQGVLPESMGEKMFGQKCKKLYGGGDPATHSSKAVGQYLSQLSVNSTMRQHPEGRKENSKYLQWRYDWEQEKPEGDEKSLSDSKDLDRGQTLSWSKGVAEHGAVLGALARALAATEDAYLDMADQALDENPELALMGSCVLVMLMKDEDVYIMNVGDSRAILAQHPKVDNMESSLKHSRVQNIAISNSYKADDHDRVGARDSMLRQELERIIEETPTELAALEAYDKGNMGLPAAGQLLGALQLSSDHSTNIDEEVSRIRAEHPDDDLSICNDRVKGSLKVTRAFGAGFLKQPKWNSALLEMFRIDFIGTTPYITCTPFLNHHRLGPDDHFLVLSSDGLYQYMSNEEVIAHVEWFMEKFPDGDPAQHLIEEVLFRAAKNAGMDFHELLEIPQGDRRKYHDDVSVMVISLEGRIWRSSG